MNRRSGRAVLVTGGGRGLGRHLARRFGEAGDRVAIVYRSDRASAVSTADEVIARGGGASVVEADVCDQAAVERMVEAVLERFGVIDVLVNNAGVVRDGLAVRMPEQAWDDVLATDLTGPFRCTREVSRGMVHRKDGHIINMASIVGLQGREGQVNYSAAKAGLIGLTKAVARELGVFNIKANAVIPGFLETAMGRTVAGPFAERIRQQQALNRVNDPEEVAEFVYRLSLMRNVSGQVFNLDSRIL